MTSLAAKFVNAYLRLTVKRKPLHLIAPETLRRVFDERAIPFLPKGVSEERIDADGVCGVWQRPQNARPGCTILYLHGGGYVFGSAHMYRTLTYRLAIEAEAELFSAEYRLAPEHPCPAAIEDAVRTYEWLLASGRPAASIAIGGDSAGGGLTLTTLQALKQKGAPLPVAAFVYSPWTDLAATGESVRTNAHADVTFQEASVREGSSRYCGALDPKDPRCSPLYGDFHGLPPLLVFVSRSEMLYDDARRVAEKARAQDVDVTFVEADRLPHVWPLYQAAMPEGREALRRTAAFVRERTSKAPMLKTKPAPQARSDSPPPLAGKGLGVRGLT
jgi:acetyl esterase/lipase